MNNPFGSFPARPPARILIYGDPGMQKTRRALMQMPGPIAYIDLECGGACYADVAPPGSGYMLTKSIADVRSALGFLASKEGQAYATVVIDPVSVLWSQLQEVYRAKASAKKRIEPEDVIIDTGTWGRLGGVHGSIMAMLLNLNQHVVVIGRGKEATDDAGHVTGYHFTGQKDVTSLLSTVIETRRDGDRVIKDRSGALKEGPHKGRVDLAVIVGAAGTEVRTMETDEDAARRDAAGPPQLTAGQSKAVAALAACGLEAPSDFGPPHTWTRTQLQALSDLVQTAKANTTGGA